MPRLEAPPFPPPLELLRRVGPAPRGVGEDKRDSVVEYAELDGFLSEPESEDLVVDCQEEEAIKERRSSLSPVDAEPTAVWGATDGQERPLSSSPSDDKNNLRKGEYGKRTRPDLLMILDSLEIRGSELTP